MASIVSYFFSPNVGVHLRRTLCDVRWNVLLAPIIHRLFLASAQNRFRAVVAVRIAPVEGPLVVQLPYILSQRQGSGDSAPCALYPGPPCWTEFSSFYGRFSRGRRGKSKNRPKNRIFGLVEPLSAVFRPYFHIFAVAKAYSRPLRVYLFR